MNRMSLTDFLPSYPQYEQNEDDLFNTYDEDMYDTIRRKQEFTDTTITDEVSLPLPGTYLKHQLFIQRFLSGYTPYNAMLLWHEVGVGKTITSISVAEAMKRFGFKSTLVLVKGQNVARNFRNEIIKIEPNYIPSDALDAKGKIINERKVTYSVNQHYNINTFLIFCKEIEHLLNSSVGQAKIKKDYSNRVIIIDEVHNLRSNDTTDEMEEEDVQAPMAIRNPKDRIDKYIILYKFLHLVENCKILLLSATPMKNEASEFPYIMNLILPESKQLKTYTNENDNFKIEYLASDEVFNDKKEELSLKLKGYISYLRQSQSKETMPTVIETGIPVFPGFVPLVSLQMEETQYEDYVKAYQLDAPKEEEPKEGELRVKIEREGGVWQNCRQSILSCFPEYTTDKKEKKTRGNVAPSSIQYNAAPYMKIVKSMIGESKDPLEIISKIKPYSIKYHYILQHIYDTFTESKKDKKMGRKSFVFGKFVEGSGLFLLEQMLQKLGFSSAQPSLINAINRQEGGKAPRYAIITSKPMSNGPLSSGDVNNLLKAYNAPENIYGEYIQILIGSSTIGESRSLTCVRDIFILTPHWNYTETEQAIGRGIRSFSHKDLEEDHRNVTVHRLMAVLPDDVMKNKNINESLDTRMYRFSYKKDVDIKKIESIARQVAVDCTFNILQNGAKSITDGSRDCFYSTCQYKCFETNKKSIAPVEILKDTYNLFYTEKDYLQIKRILQSHFQRPDNYFYRFTYTLNNIMYLIQAILTVPDHVVIRSLTEIIERKERFLDANGSYSYLKRDRDIYYLSYDILHSNVDDAYYTEQGAIYPFCNKNKYLDQLENKRFENVFTFIKTNENATERIFSFHPRLVKDILKTTIELINHPKINSFNTPLARLFARQFIQTSAVDTPLLKIMIDKAKKRGLIKDNILIEEDKEFKYAETKNNRWEWVETVTVPDSDIEKLGMFFGFGRQTFYGIRDGGIFKMVDLLQEDSKTKQPRTPIKNLMYGKNKGTEHPSPDVKQRYRDVLKLVETKDEKIDMPQFEETLMNMPLPTSYKNNEDKEIVLDLVEPQTYVLDNSVHLRIKEWASKNFK